MKIIIIGFTLLIIVLVYHEWFGWAPLSAGDWNYQHAESINFMNYTPVIWSYYFGGGMGGSIPYILGLEWYYMFTTKLLSYVLPWWIIERLVWFWPFLIISYISSYLFARRFVPSPYNLIGPIIYLFNTYTFMMVSGGQMGVALAFSLVPLVFLKTYDFIIEVFEKEGKQSFRTVLKNGAALALLLSFQLLIDLRIMYVTFIGFTFFIVLSKFQLNFKSSISELFRSSIFLLIPILGMLLINSFWILPLLLQSSVIPAQIGSEYVTEDAVRFFSFARFEYAFALMHPYWFDNIFGKVEAIRPLFLIIPVLAFSALLFKSKNKRIVISFSAVALVGAFLSKGANEPFTYIYIWLFENVPGFILFRDPTKWYVLIVLSYTVLIPYSLWKISVWLKTKLKFLFFNYQKLVFVLFLFFWFITIREAVYGDIRGTLNTRGIPKEYSLFEQYVSDQDYFFRTLWVPSFQRFGVHSNLHPAIGGKELFEVHSTDEVLSVLENEDTQRYLSERSFKYIVVPHDSEKEIFIQEREYYHKEYDNAVSRLQKIPWLSQIEGFGKIQVFELDNFRDHLWTANEDIQMNYKRINPTAYQVSISDISEKNTLVFTDKYDPNWRLDTGNFLIRSEPYDKTLNSFEIDNNFQNGILYYEPQKYVTAGIIISGLALIFIISILFIKR